MSYITFEIHYQQQKNLFPRTKFHKVQGLEWLVGGHPDVGAGLLVVGGHPDVGAGLLVVGGHPDVGARLLVVRGHPDVGAGLLVDDRLHQAVDVCD